MTATQIEAITEARYRIKSLIRDLEAKLGILGAAAVNLELLGALGTLERMERDASDF